MQTVTTSHPIIDVSLGKMVIATQPCRRGDTIAVIYGTIRETPTYQTIQIGNRKHLMCNGDARFLNHSCSPNTEISIVNDVIYLIASIDIYEGTELTFDYETTEERLAVPFTCQCKSFMCRGYISGYDKKSDNPDR